MAYVQTESGTIVQTSTPQYWKEAKPLSNAAGKRLHIAQCRTSLLKSIKPGDTIYTVLRHVSRSGMCRHIDLYKMTDDGPLYLSGLAAGAMDYHTTKNGALVVSGCGMDMGYHLVYSLSRTLFRDSFSCIGKGCPSNDHTNGDRNHEPHPHSDGGYALKHRWL